VDVRQEVERGNQNINEVYNMDQHKRQDKKE